MSYYRFEVDGVGIYAKVEIDCPRDDRRRVHKPDGSWLNKVGMDYPGGASYWTEVGLERYVSSGLLWWHASVVVGRVEMFVLAELPEELLYSDDHQVILRRDDVVT